MVKMIIFVRLFMQRVLYEGENSLHAYILFFIVDLSTGASYKLSDAAYLLVVSVPFAVCSCTSMSWIKT